jgi:hypothetical protein
LSAILPGVLLDANIYRTRAGFDTLLEAEKRRGVARYADPFVVAELLAHLGDPADPDHATCRGAIYCVHARCNRGAGGECGILRDSESRLAYLVTGSSLPKHDFFTERVIAPLFADIALVPRDQPLLAQMQPHLRQIAQHVADQKARFVETARQLKATIQAIHAGVSEEGQNETMKRARRTHASAETRRGFAAGYVRGAFVNAGREPPDPLPEALIDLVYPQIATAMEFEALIWEKLAFDGAKPESRGIQSLRWDQRIAFSVGAMLNGRPLWLVTNDGDFARAAAAAGYSDRVLTRAAYETWLAN